MKVGDLSLPELQARLSGQGLTLSVGPFRILYQVRVRQAFEPFQVLYRPYPLAPANGFVDGVVSCVPEIDPDWPFRRLATCRIDGRFHSATRFMQNAVPSLEWTVNWSVATRAHWLLLLHSAVVARDGAAVILPGRSGSGKSTLAAALAARGWRLFSDEFALLQPEDGAVLPFPRAVSLKNQSIAVMRERAPQRVMNTEFPRTGKGTVGYLLPSVDDVDQQHVPADPRWVVFPRWRAGASPKLTPLNRIKTFVGLTRNAVNYDLIGEAGAYAVTQLVRRCSGYLFEYGDLDEAIDRIAGLAEGARLDRLCA